MTKRILAILAVAILLFAIFPVTVFADPVSAAVIANSFAQAITAYGAANGVSMVFDVQNSSGIGETVHDLWSRFRSSTQTADDYDTLASALFPDLYYKAEVIASGVGLANYVGVRISSTFAEYFDEFYNWLLSGPAQLVQVDNQYYEFSSSQVGPLAQPIEVVSLSNFNFANISGYYTGSNNQDGYNAGSIIGTCSWANGSYISLVRSRNTPVYGFVTGNTFYLIANEFTASVKEYTKKISENSYSYMGESLISGSTGTPYTAYGVTVRYNTLPYASGYSPSASVPSYSSLQAACEAFCYNFANPTSDDLGVQAYSDSGIADIPDTSDPNYDALNRAKDIPLDQPWDDTTYGDGSDALTGEQSTAISQDVSQVIETDRVITLTNVINPPVTPELSEVFIPLLPVTLPSFNFSLSGIWHYVRDWVSSISAFLSLTNTVWSWLPYAVYLPVYASLVIVIVLGIYKRFFM